MTCDQTAGFISQLFDGEVIPREAAIHLDYCPTCRQQLADYSRMSVELRRYASAMPAVKPPKVSWEKNPQRSPNVWDLGRQTMRIPRLAFAVMLVVIAVLSTDLVLVRARGNQPWWFELDIRFPPGGTISSVLSAKDFEGKASLDFVQPLAKSELVWTVRLIDSKDGAQEIGIRAKEVPLGIDQSSAIEQAHTAPEQVDWYVPGKSVRLQVLGSESHLPIAAEILSEAPEYDAMRQPFLPKRDDLRLIWPAMLRDGKFVGGLNGATAEASGDGLAALYIPGEGLFLFSRDNFEGATDAKLENSQLTFFLDGSSYLLFTGAPMANFDGQTIGTIWVRRLPDFKFRTSDRRDMPAVFSVAHDEVPKLASHVN